MSLRHLGYVELPAHVRPGGFDHAAVYRATTHVYVAHTINDAVDVIDGAVDRYLHSIPGLTGVAGALVSVFSRSLRPMPCNSGRRCRPNREHTRPHSIPTGTRSTLSYPRPSGGRVHRQ